jgi:hypothetical protein
MEAHMQKKKYTGTARFIKLVRLEDNPDIETLVSKHHNEFILLTIIAMRARRAAEKCKFTGMEQYQAMIGDYRNYGMTERQYRTSKKRIQEWGYATFQGSNKGTTATLTGSLVYDINGEAGDGQKDIPETDKRRADDDKEECKNVNNEKKPLPPSAERLAEKLKLHVLSLNPNAKKLQGSAAFSTLRNWGEDIDKINRLDGRDWGEIERVLDWANKDKFWNTNVLSGSKLREQFDTLFIKSSPPPKDISNTPKVQLI